MNQLPTTSYAVLGLLAKGPKSRYDVARFVESSIAHFWTIAKSQVYGELSRLEQIGYVTSSEVRQTALPDKRLFSLTPPGRKALEEWLSDPEYETDKYRSGFLVKLFFGAEIDPENLEALVDRYREGVARALVTFGPLMDQIPKTKEVAFMRATALLGMRILDTCRDWIDEEVVPLITPRNKGSRTKSKTERSRTR